MSGPHPARTLRATVTDGDDGDRLDRFLAAAVSDVSRNRLKALIESGSVHLADGSAGGGAPLTSASRKVRAGEVIVVTVPPDAPAIPQPQDIPVSIVHEDADLIVVEKPSGLVVHPAPGNPDRTLVNAILGHLARTGGLTSVGGVERPGIVHRLDKDTSGLMVVAKTDAAHRGLVTQFQARTIERVYEALVWGHVTPPSGEIDGAIGRDPRNRKRMAVVMRNGKPALTRYSVIHRFDCGVSMVECRLATGRTHQIRVHMAHIGHPVVADPVYGRGRAKKTRLEIPTGQGQLLHARSLGFEHPISGRDMYFESQKYNKIISLRDILEP